MFGKKKFDEKDPKKALENAEKIINKGFTGFATKAALGKDFVNMMNDNIAKAQDAVDMQSASRDPSSFGIDAVAEVVSIKDTGQMINFDPVVEMQLKVQPQIGPSFDMTAQALVSKIAVPRVGEMIKIKYNPADMKKIVVLQ